MPTSNEMANSKNEYIGGEQYLYSYNSTTGKHEMVHRPRPEEDGWRMRRVHPDAVAAVAEKINEVSTISLQKHGKRIRPNVDSATSALIIWACKQPGSTEAILNDETGVKLDVVAAELSIGELEEALKRKKEAMSE